MFSAGMVDFHNLSNSLTLLTYHLALDFIEVLERYSTSNFQWSYDAMENKLILEPAPDHRMNAVVNPETGETEVKDCPGWILLKVNQLLGAGKPGFSIDKAYLDAIEKSTWVRWYILALCKIVLGTIREKFESFASIGNTGIQLNGSALKSEGIEEKDKLEEQLYNREVYTGYPILTGII